MTKEENVKYPTHALDSVITINECGHPCRYENVCMLI